MGLIPLLTNVGFCSCSLCSLPQCHWSVSRDISEVISLRALVIAASRISSRVSILSGVLTSSHHGFSTSLIKIVNTAYQRSPPVGHRSSSGSSSRKVNLKMLWKMTLKYAEDAEYLV